MKTTSEVLDTISSTLAPNFAELAYCITLEGQDFNVLIDVVQKAMVEYANLALKEILEDGLGNIDATQSWDDIIDNYKQLQLK